MDNTQDLGLKPWKDCNYHEKLERMRMVMIELWRDCRYKSTVVGNVVVDSPTEAPVGAIGGSKTPSANNKISMLF